MCIFILVKCETKGIGNSTISKFLFVAHALNQGSSTPSIWSTVSPWHLDSQAIPGHEPGLEARALLSPAMEESGHGGPSCWTAHAQLALALEQTGHTQLSHWAVHVHSTPAPEQTGPVKCMDSLDQTLV